jgi:hypothetical protein
MVGFLPPLRLFDDVVAQPSALGQEYSLEHMSCYPTGWPLLVVARVYLAIECEELGQSRHMTLDACCRLG